LTDMYFKTGIFKFDNSEILVDGGAFDGDTIESFFSIAGPKFKHVHAFEADPQNLQHLKSKYGHSPEVSVHPYGLWDSDVTLQFSSAGDAGTVLDDGSKGDIEIACKSLDEMNIGDVSFIKLDIEGAEIPAILGAADTIARYKPKLAIAAYHKADDLIEIPSKIIAIRDDYQFFLRHHSYYHNDTVLYAF